MQINSLGGISAIVISHPHYYTTYADWSRTFSCPVYIAQEDRSWLEDFDNPDVDLSLLIDQHTPIVPSVTAIRCGGHFEGSLCLHWDGRLFIADTIITVPVSPVFSALPSVKWLKLCSRVLTRNLGSRGSRHIVSCGVFRIGSR